MAGIDRRKHDIDVVERVLDDLPAAESSRTEVIALDSPPWRSDTTTSAVELTITLPQPRREPPFSGRSRHPR